MMTAKTRTWTEHTFRCERCTALCYASQEAIDEIRQQEGHGPEVTDVQIVQGITFCLACLEGEQHVGERAVPRCYGSEDADGSPTCDGPDVQHVRVRTPENDIFRTQWCAECRIEAQHKLGYEVTVTEEEDLLDGPC